MAKLSSAPVAFFDSGVGGLTAVSSFLEKLPSENIVYFADTANLPYGNKSSDEIFEFVSKAVDFFRKFLPKLIVIACGTASSVVLKKYVDLKCLSWDVPILDVVLPACSDSVKLTRNKKIGVIGTKKTIELGVYREKLKEIDPDLDVFCKSCPELASIIERDICSTNGNDSICGNNIKAALNKYLSPFDDKNIDTLILGCTHYALVKNCISEYLGPDITLLDIGHSASVKAVDFLVNNKLINTSNRLAKFTAFLTKEDKRFSYKANQILKKHKFSDFNVNTIET